MYYYDEIINNGSFGYSSRDEKKEQLIRVILQGALEIKDELRDDLDEEAVKVIKEKLKDRIR